MSDNRFLRFCTCFTIMFLSVLIIVVINASLASLGCPRRPYASSGVVSRREVLFRRWSEVSPVLRYPALSQSHMGSRSAVVQLVLGSLLTRDQRCHIGKHSPTSRSYLNPTRTRSPSGLATHPPLRIGLSNGISTRIRMKRACSDVKVLLSTSITWPRPLPISHATSSLIRSNGKPHICT